MPDSVRNQARAKHPDFWKSIHKKKFLRRIEKYFPNIFEIEHFGFQNFSKPIFPKSKFFLRFFNFRGRNFLTLKIFEIQNFRSQKFSGNIFQIDAKLFFVDRFSKIRMFWKGKIVPHSSCTIMIWLGIRAYHFAVVQKFISRDLKNSVFINQILVFGEIKIYNFCQYFGHAHTVQKHWGF